MKITAEWLTQKRACFQGIAWFAAQTENDGAAVVKKLMAEDRYDWANWLICRLFDRRQRIQYAVFAAEQVLDIFEKKYPDDKRPRLTIEAARACVEDNSAAAAYHAAAAAVAAYDATAAYDAAYHAAAAYDVADAANDAANAANAAYHAAAVAADAANADNATYHVVAAAVAAYHAAYAAAAFAGHVSQQSRLEYGLKLITNEDAK